MSTGTRGVVGVADLAIRLGVQLVGQFNDAARADPARTRALFGRLVKFVRALPPGRHVTEQLQANLAVWPRTWEAGEFRAARYQMVQLIRQLRNYRDEWDGDGTPAGTPPLAAAPGAA